ncbi:MAG: hypothetical protein LBM56_01300 [Burkholderiaceae bacterium]|jgi:hypothetical protein|nr:hypothetical protein [Burkholderiaceae bacterium]
MRMTWAGLDAKDNEVVSNGFRSGADNIPLGLQATVGVVEEYLKHNDPDNNIVKVRIDVSLGSACEAFPTPPTFYKVTPTRTLVEIE